MPFVDQAPLDRSADVAGQQLHSIAATGEGDEDRRLPTHRAPLALRSFGAIAKAWRC
jgi:hypothetical protein